jgi:spore germination protein
MRQPTKGRKLWAFPLASIVLAGALAAVLLGPWRGQPAPTTPATTLPPTAGSAAGGQQMPVFAGDARELAGLQLPTTGPQSGSQTGCTRRPLNKSNGAWVPDWADDPSQPVLTTTAASQIGVVDLAWLTLGGDPSTIMEGQGGGRPLSDALDSVALASPCAWRFVTVQDAANQKLMAQILLNPDARRANVLALADEMASQPLADGLTLDYEFSLPETQADLSVYARAGGIRGHDPALIIQALTRGYDQLVWDLTMAMHEQHRLLRVAVLPRVDNSLDNALAGNIRPYVLDYTSIAAIADQIDVMAYDVHWPGGDPGPIAPMTGASGVRSVVAFIRDQNVPARKLAVAVPVYSYDWTVDANGLRRSGSAPATTYTATQLASAATQWRKVGASSGETEYEYTDGSGRHIVWDASSGLAYEAGQLRAWCGCAVLAWRISNTDPAGSTLVADVAGS